MSHLFFSVPLASKVEEGDILGWIVSKFGGVVHFTVVTRDSEFGLAFLRSH